MSGPILPGAALGVLGSGQLGRMFTLEARRMGYRVHVFSPERQTPAGSVADVEVVADYGDLDAVRRFARGVSAVTFEFENVPHATASAAADETLVRPAGRVLHLTQNRVREKQFLEAHGLPVSAFAVVERSSDMREAVSCTGFPAILKTARFGYDGKGQMVVRCLAEADAAWRALGAQTAVLEAFVDFELELSVVAARASDASVAHFGVVANDHRDHILDVSVAPAHVAAAVADEAVALTRTVCEALDLVGVLCVELFLTRDGRLLINEVAPRPHNSGHFTIDACVTSQFEQQVRAVCGLPLGSTRQIAPAAMANLLGHLWSDGEPDWAAAAAYPTVKLHLYGKSEPRKGRKMGHLTALADTPAEATALVRAARVALG